MTIGDDLVKVFEEIGTACVITKSDLTEFSEYFDYEAFPDHSTVFIRQNCFVGTFGYSTEVEEGDTVVFNEQITLVMNKKQETFENASVVQNAYLIKCNTATGVLSRKATNRVSYKNVITWPTHTTGIAALHYAASADTEAVLLKDVAVLEKEMHTLYLASHIDVQKGDRWQHIPDAQAYEIVAITNFRYSGLSVCQITKDYRE